jgi:hypothetical protein
MAISKPPVKKAPGVVAPAASAPDEKKIAAVISRGSSALEAEAPAPALKNFNVRLPAETLRQIDQLRARRPRKPTSPKLGVSTQDWILEAIAEKIQREQKKYGSGT